MDPLSLTLAVVTLATAVKDLVELAQAICDAFAKAPQNYKKSLRLASDILRASKKLQTLYDKKKEILESADDLRESLQELIQEMTLVRNECSRLIPPVAEKLRDKFRIAFYSFWNRKKVEDLVLELKSRIDNCHMHFLVLSNARTEAAVNEISRNVNPGTIARRVQSYVEEQQRYNFNMPRISDARLFQFSQSYSSISMTRIEDTISDSDLYKVVLRRELGKIWKSLGRLTSKWHEDPPAEICQPFPPLVTTADLHFPLVSDSAAHQSLVIEVFQLQSHIESGRIFEINVWIDSIRCDLSNLGMLEDSLNVALCFVELWKKIISASPIDDSNVWPYFVHALTMASICYSNIGDRDKLAYAYSQEAVNIIQEKLDGGQSLEVQYLFARNLCFQGENKHAPMLTEVSELIYGAAVTMETFLGPQAEQVSAEIQSALSSVDLNSADWSAVEANAAKFISCSHGTICMHSFLYIYSRILIELSHIQQAQGYIIKAHTTKKHVLMVLQHLLLEYPNSKQLLNEIARVAFELCSPGLQYFNSLAENLAFARECTSKYRKLLQTNFPPYVIRLLDSLQRRRKIFLLEGMIRESEGILEEMTALSELASQRCQDVKLPSESDGDCQLHLASIFYDEGRFSEGIHAAHNALEQYSALAFLDPDRSPLKAIKAATKLCQLFAKTDQQQSVLLEGFKALKLIDKVTETDKTIQDFTVSDEYGSLIDSIMNALAALPLDPMSVGKASAMINRLQKLFSSSDKFDFLSDTPATYMDILTKKGLVDDAIKYGQDFVAAWEEKYIYSSSNNTAYLICLTKLIALLTEHGRTNDALKYSTNMTVVVPLSWSHSYSLFRSLQCDLTTTTHIRLLCDASLNGVVSMFAQGASMTSCSGSDDPSIGTHNACVLSQLLDLAAMQLNDYSHHAKSSDFFQFFLGHTDNFSSFAMLNQSMYILSDALFDAGRTTESLAHLMEMKDLLKSRECSNWRSTIDKVNHLVSATIARIHFSQCNYAQANSVGKSRPSRVDLVMTC